MKVYLLEFGGKWLGGQMIIIDETKRKAFNKAKKELKEMELLDKNSDLTLHDIQEINTDEKSLIIIDDGDY